MIDVLNPCSSIISADLDAVEKRFNFTFPVALREQYLHANGGRPKRNRFADELGVCILHQFLPVKFVRRPLDTLETTLEETKVRQSLMPDYLVPFAIDPGGDYYCFSTRPADLGAIYAFHMDLWREPERAMDRLAASVADFFSKLRSKEELKASGSQVA